MSACVVETCSGSLAKMACLQPGLWAGGLQARCFVCPGKDVEAQKPAEREKEAGGDTAVKVGGKAVDFAKIDIPHAFEILKVCRCSWPGKQHVASPVVCQ